MTTTRVAIRPRRSGDLDALVRGLALVAAADGYPSRWPDDPDGWLRTDEPHGAWVAGRDGELLGQVVLRRAVGQAPVTMWTAATGEDPSSCGLVSRLFVVPDARGRGVGQALLEAAVAAAAVLGLRPLLDVSDANQAAVRLYRRLGWTEVGTYEERFHAGGPLELLHCFAAPPG